MSDALLPYYNRELVALLRRLAAEFAAAHPKIAGRLRLAPDAVDDPHVARLLEGRRVPGGTQCITGWTTSSRNSRTRCSGCFTRTTWHRCRPAPSSSSTASPRLSHRPRSRPQGPRWTASRSAVPKPCRFRTAYPLTLWPVVVESVRLSGLPLAAPANQQAAGAVGVLRITLKCANPETTFAQLGVDRLRFFLRGAANVAPPLYELLCTNVLSVAYADGPNDPTLGDRAARRDRAGRLRAGGAALPCARAELFRVSGRSPNISRSRKNSCFSILPRSIPRPWCPAATGWRSSCISIARARVEPARVGADALALGCTPAVSSVHLLALRAESR